MKQALAVNQYYYTVSVYPFDGICNQMRECAETGNRTYELPTAGHNVLATVLTGPPDCKVLQNFCYICLTSIKTAEMMILVLFTLSCPHHDLQKIEVRLCNSSASVTPTVLLCRKAGAGLSIRSKILNETTAPRKGNSKTS